VAIDDEGGLVIIRARFRLGHFMGAAAFTVMYPGAFPEVTAKEAAIEFNGKFQLISGQDKYALVTEDKPHIFWIDDDDRLFCQYGDEAFTRVQLASQALFLTACRGWNALDHPDHDMGLVVAYIKYNGVVAYRAYMDTPALPGIWAPEEILTEAGDGNTFVHVHRLNDYRMGFSVTGCNKEFITPRSLVGQGIKPEHNVIGISTITNFAQLRVTEPVTPPLILYAEYFDDDQYKVVITGNYPFALKSDMNPHSQNLSITQSGANKPITELSIIDGALHLTFSATVTPSSDMVVRAHVLTFLQYILEDGQRPYWPDTNIIIPGEPLRYSFAEHNVIGISAETQFEQTRINYPSREFAGEHNVIGISANATLTHTHIAYNYITHNQPGEYNKIGISAAVVTFNMVPIGTDPL